MASLDKTSVRNEVDRLKADFEALRAKNKVSSEVSVLMNSMLMIVEIMLSIFLEPEFNLLVQQVGLSRKIPDSGFCTQGIFGVGY